MKWLVLLALLILVFGMIALRFRPQIQAALQIWRMYKQIKQVNQANQPIEKQMPKREKIANEALVRCANCGKWIPQSDALNLRKQTFYCSSNCVEKAVSIG
jgi:Sec-independent protein translocase protein TatA